MNERRRGRPICRWSRRSAQTHTLRPSQFSTSGLPTGLTGAAQHQRAVCVRACVRARGSASQGRAVTSKESEQLYNNYIPISFGMPLTFEDKRINLIFLHPFVSVYLIFNVLSTCFSFGPVLFSVCYCCSSLVEAHIIVLWGRILYTHQSLFPK